LWFTVASPASLAMTWPFNKLWPTDNQLEFSMFPNPNSQ
jgi:hypothetical protein